MTDQKPLAYEPIGEKRSRSRVELFLSPFDRLLCSPMGDLAFGHLHDPLGTVRDDLIVLGE